MITPIQLQVVKGKWNMHAKVFVNGKAHGRPGIKGGERLYLGVSIAESKDKQCSIKYSADIFGRSGKYKTFGKWNSLDLKETDKLEITFSQKGKFDSPVEKKKWKIEPKFSIKRQDAAEKMVKLSMEFLGNLADMSSAVSTKTKKEFLSSLGSLNISVGDMLLKSIALEFPSLHKKYPLLKEIVRGA